MAHWFKFYGPEYLSDQKFLGMDGNSRSCWLTLLCYASDHGGEVEYLTEDQLMVMAGVPMGSTEWTKTSGVLQRFVQKGMIEVEGDVIRILNWGKRQTLTPYERVKRHREKAKNDNEMITTDKNRGEEIRIDKKETASPSTPVFERKIREKDEEYLALVKDLGDKDFLTTTKIQQIVLDEFLPHWLERGPNARKARWEKESSFDPWRRLRTWINNYHKWGGDWKCREGYWHPKQESLCNHSAPRKEEPLYIPDSLKEGFKLKRIVHHDDESVTIPT